MKMKVKIINTLLFEESLAKINTRIILIHHTISLSFLITLTFYHRAGNVLVGL